MANNTAITEMYENLPKIAKIIIQIFLGGVIGGIYRILRFLETKNVVTLVVGILVLVTGVFIKKMVMPRKKSSIRSLSP